MSDASRPAHEGQMTRPAAAEDRAYWNGVALRAVTDEAAFTLLYNEFFPRVYKYLLAKSRSSDLANEAVSRTFLNMHAHLDEYDADRGSFAPWLFRIALNELRQLLRQKQKSLAVSWGEDFDPPAPPRETPEACLLQKEGDEELRAAILRLPLREQEILKLTYWLDLPAAEVAAALGMSQEAVWASLSRSRKALKKDLADK